MNIELINTENYDVISKNKKNNINNSLETSEEINIFEDEKKQKEIANKNINTLNTKPTFIDTISNYFKELFGLNKKSNNIEYNEDENFSTDDDDIEQDTNDVEKDNNTIDWDDNDIYLSQQEDNYIPYSDPRYDVNGKIDMPVEQGNLEDCSFISMVYSLAQSESGKEIIKNSIQQNYDKNGNKDGYNVTFKGLDKTYTITQKELDEAEAKTNETMAGKSDYSYSRGDKDMLLLELAWSKCWTDNDGLEEFDTGCYTYETNPNMPDGLSNVNIYKLYYVLTGEPHDGDSKNQQSIIELGEPTEHKEIFNKLWNIAQNSETVTINTLDGFEVKTTNNTTEDIIPYHRYGVKSVNKDSITIVNPYNTGKEINISKEEMEKNQADFKFNYGNIA